MIPDLDIYRAARLPIDQHREDTPIRAAELLRRAIPRERLSGEGVRQLYLQAKDPDIALLDMWLSGHLAVAQCFDRGELEAENVDALMVTEAAQPR